METITDFCTFCFEDENKTYFETKNFQVRLSLGAIVEGYSLILPKEHFHCIGALPNELIAEYLEVKAYIRNVLEQSYGSCIFYEHGRAGFCNVQPGEQLCYHAHTHAVPGEIDFKKSLQTDGLTLIELKDNYDLFTAYKEYGHYLFYESNNHQQYIIPINQPLRRQYLRHLTAKEIGNEKLADWAKYPEMANIKSAKKKLSSYVKKYPKKALN